jgi:hypothetical protein
MNKLVLHHTYADGLAFDASLNRNHGLPIAVTAGAGPFANSFHFTSGDSRISVEPSPSLENLFAIRAVVRCYLTPTDTSHRFNLMEGHLSFALFVNPDGSLQATILGRLYPIARQKWKGRVSFFQNSDERKRRDADSAKRDYTSVAPV